MRPFVLLALLGALPSAAAAQDGDTIRFKHHYQLCLCMPDGTCAPCADLDITLAMTGKGHLRRTWQEKLLEDRDFTVPREQAEAFRARLAGYRPIEAQTWLADGACKENWTDGETYDVDWLSGGKRVGLHFYTGCDPQKHAALRIALERALPPIPSAE